ncbi:hypothetical protein ACHQM5_019829 [Ranunculus cassubicifolius]
MAGSLEEKTSSESQDVSSQITPIPSQTTQTANQTAPNSAVNDPYFIHPSDNPTTVLFSPLLQGDNYPTWVRGISKALNAKNKLGFVDGSIPCPTDPITRACWKRCDDLVGMWITNSVHTDMRPSLMYADSSYAIWQDLKVRFTHSNAPKLYQLRTTVTGLKQDTLSVTAYHTKLKALWDEIDSLTPTEPCICGAGKSLLERHERDRTMEFLQGLHDRFSSLRSQILLIESLPSAQRIFNIVKQEEEQQFINASVHPSVDSAALNINKCDPRSSRPTNITNKRQRPYCDHCSKYGHTRQTCYQIHGFPPTKPKGTTHPSTFAAAGSHEQVLPSLSADQYSRLLAILSTPAADPDTAPKVNLTGNLIKNLFNSVWY